MVGEYLLARVGPIAIVVEVDPGIEQPRAACGDVHGRHLTCSQQRGKGHTVLVVVAICVVAGRCAVGLAVRFVVDRRAEIGTDDRMPGAVVLQQCRVGIAGGRAACGIGRVAEVESDHIQRIGRHAAIAGGRGQIVRAVDMTARRVASHIDLHGTTRCRRDRAAAVRNHASSRRCR